MPSIFGIKEAHFSAPLINCDNRLLTLIVVLIAVVSNYTDFVSSDGISSGFVPPIINPIFSIDVSFGNTGSMSIK